MTCYLILIDIKAVKKGRTHIATVHLYENFI